MRHEGRAHEAVGAVYALAAVGIDLREEVAHDGQRHHAALAACGEVHGLILAADPCAHHQLGRHAHEPGVAVLVRGAGLAAHLHAVESVLPLQAARRTRRHHALQHREHGVGRGFAHGVLRLGDEAGDLVALSVLDARDEDRIVVHALVGEGREGARQLVYVRLGGAQAERRHGVDVAADAHVVDEVGHGRGLLGLLHDPCRVVVAAAGQAPAQGVELAELLHLAGLLGRPGGAVGRLDGHGQVRHGRAGRHAEVVDGEGVDERFDRRADLTLALAGHVVLEVAEVRAADVGLDEARAGATNAARMIRLWWRIESRGDITVSRSPR